MHKFKSIIAETGKLIDNSPLAVVLKPLWQSVEWAVSDSNANAEAAVDESGNSCIHLYPGLLKSSRAGERVLCEFGRFVLLRAGEHAQEIWANKLELPENEHIELAAAKLADPSLREKCHEYQDILNYGYPQKGHSVERLVFINIVNALLANNIVYPDTVGVDIKTWGPAAEYCARKKFHSLVPLTSAYAPPAVHAEFGSALAALVIDNLSNVGDNSVAFTLRGIIQRIAQLATST